MNPLNPGLRSEATGSAPQTAIVAPPVPDPARFLDASGKWHPWTWVKDITSCDAAAAAVVQRNFSGAAYGSILLSMLVAATLAGQVPFRTLVFWMELVWLATALRWYQMRRYPGPAADQAALDIWARWYLAAVALSGTAWGLLGVFFLRPDLYDFLVVPLGGVVAGSVMTGAVYPPALFAFAVPALTPVVVGMIRDGTGDAYATAGMMILFGVLMIGMGRHLLLYFRDALKSKGISADLEQKLVRTRREADAAEELLFNLSHELRTPLNAIGGFAQLQVQEIFGPLGDKRYGGYARDIRDSAERLLNLVATIEDLSRIHAGTLNVECAPVDPAGAISEAVELAKRESKDGKANCALFVQQPLPLVLSDRQRLVQVIAHLLSNAWKFTPPSGLITVRARVNLTGELVIAVEDTGIGIAPEDMPTAMRIFGQIARGRGRPHAGMGLGLPLVSRLAESLGARFELASREGAGTRAVMTFPPQRLMPKEEKEAPDSPALHTTAG